MALAVRGVGEVWATGRSSVGTVLVLYDAEHQQDTLSVHQQDTLLEH